MSDTTSDNLTVKTEISDDAMDMAIEAMFRLYTYPHTAVIREYVSNACDEHSTAGSDVPVGVSLRADRSEGTYILTVVDHGRGMNLDTLTKVYTQIKLSGKRDDESTVGGFGIGAKAGLAVSDEGFDVLTSTGEQAHLLRCRHVTRGNIANHIDVLDPEGIDTGTTVSVTMRMNGSTFTDVATMLHALAMVNDIEITLHDITVPDFMEPYVVRQKGDVSVLHHHAVLEGRIAPYDTQYCAVLALARAYRDEGLIVLDHYRDYMHAYDQFRVGGVAYLANTPYPMDFASSGPFENESLFFGLTDIPVDTVAVPRHRESLSGLDTSVLTELSIDAHNRVLDSLVEKFREPLIEKFDSVDYNNPAKKVLTDLIVESQFPATEEIAYSKGLVSLVISHILRQILDDTEATAVCEGVLVFSSKKAMESASSYGIIERPYLTNMASNIISRRSTAYTGPEPFAVICVPDLPASVNLTTTEISRIRHNLKRFMPDVFDEARGAVLTRSVPDHVWSASGLHHEIVTSRRKAPMGRGEDGEACHAPYNGQCSWRDLTSKIVRNTGSSARKYIRITLGDSHIDSVQEYVSLTLDEARERLEDDDALFVATSRALTQMRTEMNKNMEVQNSLPLVVANRLAGLAGSRKRDYMTGLNEDGHRLLSWNGISEIYIYADETASAIRKDITKTLIARIREFRASLPEYVEYANGIKTESCMQLANAHTLRQIASLVEASVNPTGKVVSRTCLSLDAIGMSETLTRGAKRHFSTHYDTLLDETLSGVSDVCIHRGPLDMTVSSKISKTLLESVLGSSERADILVSWCSVEDMRRRSFDPDPIDLEAMSKEFGGIEGIAAQIDGIALGEDPATYSSDLNPESPVLPFISAHIDRQLARFRRELDTMTTLFTGGTRTFEEILNAAREEIRVYNAESAS